MVEEGGTIEWVSGSFGSHVSYLYPMSYWLAKARRRWNLPALPLQAKARIWIPVPKVVHIAPEHYFLY
ncbi:MAG: hypothetical protein ACLTDC_13230 [Lachnospiraceae bacterium]